MKYEQLNKDIHAIPVIFYSLSHAATYNLSEGKLSWLLYNEWSLLDLKLKQSPQLLLKQSGPPLNICSNA